MQLVVEQHIITYNLTLLHICGVGLPSASTLQVLNPKGMIKDTNDTALPNEYFSHTQNARFEDNAAKKVLGQDQVFGTPTVAPYFALNWKTGANSYWFYAGSSKIYRYNGSSHEDFTRVSGGDYSTNLTASGNWTGSIFNGLSYFEQWSR